MGSGSAFPFCISWGFSCFPSRSVPCSSGLRAKAWVASRGQSSGLLYPSTQLETFLAFFLSFPSFLPSFFISFYIALCRINVMWQCGWRVKGSSGSTFPFKCDSSVVNHKRQPLNTDLPFTSTLNSLVKGWSFYWKACYSCRKCPLTAAFSHTQYSKKINFGSPLMQWPSHLISTTLQVWIKQL